MLAAFRCRLGDFDTTTTREKLGNLIESAANSGFATHYHKQTDAWRKQIAILGEMAARLITVNPEAANWSFLLEYEIPRRQKRPDVILLADELIFVIEFKIDATSYSGADEWQVQSYALDLRDFHAASADSPLIPILVATNALEAVPAANAVLESNILAVQKTNSQTLSAAVKALHSIFHRSNAKALDPEAWELSAYRPTPTIIEAAELLFAGNQVADISHNFATNLDQTCNEIIAAIRASQVQGLRTICFVTGTPGAGKTLAGLKAVHNPTLRREGRPAAMFLSGNGPLVKIIRAALARDRQRLGIARQKAAREVSTFIANVHQFLVHHGISDTSVPPPENAIVFDEAQRAWNADAVNKEHKVLKSEPALILDIMERAQGGWCTIVALIGEGQEINRGEAGITEWGRALNGRSQPWHVIASADLFSTSRAPSTKLFESPPAQHIKITTTDRLHLAVSTRSPRAKTIGQWVDNLLNGRISNDYRPFSPTAEFPVAFTRDLPLARNWLHDRSEDFQRAGLLASSGALRLRADGIEVTSGFRRGYSYEDWFLAGAGDTRCSAQLEVAATEFECQGLELDWVGICWGGDFVIDPQTNSWWCRKFRGTTWNSVRGEGERQYLLNKYRVLLTRARRGMIIWIPRGNANDATQNPALFDSTARYLQHAGIPELS